MRRFTRHKQPSIRYSTNEYVMLTYGGESKNYQEVLSHEKRKEWLSAMQDEMKYLYENNTYDLAS